MRRMAGPNYELERGIEPFTFAQRDINQVFQLLDSGAANRGLAACGET